MHKFTSPGYLQMYLRDNGLVGMTGNVIEQSEGGITVDVDGVKFWAKNSLIPFIEEYLTLREYVVNKDNIEKEDVVSTESILESIERPVKQFIRVEQIARDEDGSLYSQLLEDSGGEYYFIPIIPNNCNVTLGIYPTLKGDYLGNINIKVKYDEEYKMFILEAMWFKELEGNLYQTGYDSVTVNASDMINVCSNGTIIITPEKITRSKYAF